VPEVEMSTPANTPEPIGPDSRIAIVGSLITIGGTAGVNRARTWGKAHAGGKQNVSSQDRAPSRQSVRGARLSVEFAEAIRRLIGGCGGENDPGGGQRLKVPAAKHRPGRPGLLETVEHRVPEVMPRSG
jgi:hypothetical protein